MTLVIALALLFSTGVPAVPDSTSNSAPIACTLSGSAFTDRVGVLQEFLGKAETVTELENGYAFRFSGDPETIDQLLTLVSTERECCSFFGFNINFSPNRGPIDLAVTGTPEVKAFLTPWLDPAIPPK